MAVAEKSHTELNPVQMSLLKLFNREMSEQETRDIKKLMVSYYSEKLKEEVSNVVEDKGYTQEDFERILNGDA